MNSQLPPRPDNGPKLDVEIWMKMVDEMFGEGPVADAVSSCRICLEREKYEDADLWAVKASWMIQGAANVVLKSHRDVDPSQDLEPVMTPWKQLNERARIVMHHMRKLPEEMRIWKARAEKAG